MYFTRPFTVVGFYFVFADHCFFSISWLCSLTPYWQIIRAKKRAHSPAWASHLNFAAKWFCQDQSINPTKSAICSFHVNGRQKWQSEFLCTFCSREYPTGLLAHFIHVNTLQIWWSDSTRVERVILLDYWNRRNPLHPSTNFTPATGYPYSEYLLSHLHFNIYSCQQRDFSGNFPMLWETSFRPTQKPKSPLLYAIQGNVRRFKENWS